ncbi:MAG: hypothetical protein V1800_15985, partial [Candidatus Latescibacterota bacterium]
MRNIDLARRDAVVTGGNGELGRVIAWTLADWGAWGRCISSGDCCAPKPSSTRLRAADGMSGTAAPKRCRQHPCPVMSVCWIRGTCQRTPVR